MIYWRDIRSLILFAALGMLSYSISAQNTIHHVVRGDTIFSLSRHYWVSQEELMRRNGLSDPSRLQAGMRLVIPSAAASPAPSLAPATYTVQPGDTLFSIARNSRVTLQALRDINGFSANHVLRAGATIRIPGQTPQAPQVARSTVVPQAVQRGIARPPSRPIDPSIRWPVSAREIQYLTSNMGVLVTGVESESIKSLTRGTVIHASPWRGYGNVVIVETVGGYKYLYGSFASLSVKRGDVIEPGAELGKLGIYPASGRPDLVFIVSRNGSPIDPATAPRS